MRKTSTATQPKPAQKSNSTLAKYARKQVNFQDVFGVEPDTLITQMDKWAADVANQSPKHPTKLGTVGVHRNNIPVSVLDPLDNQLTHHLNCSIRISVSLEAMRRGIHVSRMGNVLAEVASAKTYRNLLEFTTALAEQMAKSQGAASCHVKAEGVYTFVELVKGWKPAKDKQSIEAIPLLAETFCSETSPRIKSAGFRVSHMTACPCVQGALQTLLRLKNATTQVPLFTHSQRCETEILLHDVKQYFDLVKVLALVDECTTRTQNTLPREHELALVYSSHKKPSFLEDVVRCCATEFYKTFSGLFNPGGLVKVSSTSMESIHSFDLHAEGKYPDGPAGVSQGTQNPAT